LNIVEFSRDEKRIADLVGTTVLTLNGLSVGPNPVGRKQ